jgi:hypothetical protein
MVIPAVMITDILMVTRTQKIKLPMIVILTNMIHV